MPKNGPIKKKQYVKTADGDQIEVPKVVWAKERLVLDVIKEMIDQLKDDPQLQQMAGEELTVDKFGQIFPLLVEHLPGAVSSICSIALDKPQDWVENNLDSEAIMEVVFPFVMRFSNLLSDRVMPLVQKLGISPKGISTTMSSQSSEKSSGGQPTKSSGSTQERRSRE